MNKNILEEEGACRQFVWSFALVTWYAGSALRGLEEACFHTKSTLGYLVDTLGLLSRHSRVDWSRYDLLL